MGVRASVLGASGFTGGEILRYLSGHPAMEVAVVSAGTRAGDPLGQVQPHLMTLADTRLARLDDALGADVDVCFSCLPHGELPAHLPSVSAPLLVDIAGDHRGNSGWVYGLTEYVRESLVDTSRIANPGCYPTASLLALIPFLKADVVESPIVIDALSGFSGAGRKAADHLLLATAEGNASAYGAIPHRHVAEIERNLESFGGVSQTVSFTPHLIPTARGVLVTARCRLKTALTDAGALKILNDSYKDEPFVHITTEWPSTKPVAGTNHALVSAKVDGRTGWLICSAAVDNLGKGAAGQAIQNANVALGIEEGAGLTEVGVWP